MTTQGKTDAALARAVNCIHPSEFDPKFAMSGRTVFECFSLLPSSPCRNMGLNLPWMDGATDISGKRRIKFGIVDIGALEYSPVSGINVSFR